MIKDIDKIVVRDLQITLVDSVELAIEKLKSLNEYLPLVRLPKNDPFLKRNEFTHLEDPFTIKINMPSHRDYNHIILGNISSPEGLLANRLAQSLGAQFMDTSAISPTNPGQGINRYTIFLGPSESNFEYLSDLKSTLRNTIGYDPITGILTAESFEYLTWMVFKQVLKWSSGRNRGVSKTLLIENLSDTKLAFSIDLINQNNNLIEFIEKFSSKKEILYINGHSRHYCGVFRGKDYLMGLCCVPENGNNDVCFDNKVCYFKGGNKISLSDSNSDKIFYNGCFTGNFGNNSFNLPRHVNPLFSSLRGICSEFIGNIRPGHFTNYDLYWFIALSYLKYTPAEAVSLITSMQKDELREGVFSLVYIGCVINPNWDTQGVIAGEIENETNESFSVVFPNLSALLVIEINDVKWSNWAYNNKLTFTSKQAELIAQVHIIKDIPNNKSIFLIENSLNEIDVKSFTIEVKNSTGLKPDTSLNILTEVITNLHFLKNMTSFTKIIEDQVLPLQDYLCKHTILIQNRSKYLNYDYLIESIKKIEYELIIQLDVKIINAIIHETNSYWNFQEQYSPFFNSIFIEKKCTCFNCKKNGLFYELSYVADESIRREQLVCAECGIFSDLFTSQLRLEFINSSCNWNNESYNVTLKIRNDSSRTRTYVIYLLIEGIKDPNKFDLNKYTFTLNSNEEIFTSHSITPLKKPSGFYWLKAYIVSEAQIGFINKPIII